MKSVYNFVVKPIGKRYNNAGTKTFVKFEGDTPEFLSGKTQYTYSEIKAELNKSEWINTDD